MKAMQKIMHARENMTRADIEAVREAIHTQARLKHNIHILRHTSKTLKAYIEQIENVSPSFSEYLTEARDFVRQINQVVEEFDDHVDGEISNYEARLKQINCAMRDKETRQLHGEELQISLRGLRVELQAFSGDVTAFGATFLQWERMRELCVAVDVTSARSELI